MSPCEDAPWLAAVLQPGSLFVPEGNQKVHIYNWKEKKVYHILDTGNVYKNNAHRHFFLTFPSTLIVFNSFFSTGKGGLILNVHVTFSPNGQ